jgi:hypothetical protein
MSEVFQSFWHGGEISPLAWLSLSTFVDKGHDVRVYCYDDLDLPPGVTGLSANSVVDRSELRRVHGSIAPFADLFRYRLLWDAGGWWIDTDVMLTGRVAGAPDIAFAEEEPGAVNVAVLKVPPRHPLLAGILGELNGVDIADLPYSATGPDMFTRHVSKLGMQSRCLDTQDVYPIHWLEAFKFLLPECQSEIETRVKTSTFVHIWNGMFRDWGFSFDRHAPIAGSFLDKYYRTFDLYRKYDLSEAPDLRGRIAEFLGQDWVVQHAARVGVTLP